VAEKAVIETSEPAEVLSVEAVQEAMLKRGRIVWFKCRSCHELGADGPHKVGPNLHQIMGATAGVKPGFVYSEAMKASGVVWDEDTLDAFIKKPTDYIKGTKMAFVGIRKESDRDALIAYMIENSEPEE
jgi:cytochrome c